LNGIWQAGNINVDGLNMPGPPGRTSETAAATTNSIKALKEKKRKRNKYKHKYKK